MILKAENILGGCILTSTFAEDGRADGAATLTSEETSQLVLALNCGMDFVKEDSLFVTWRAFTEGTAVFLIGASHCIVDMAAALSLARYLSSKRDGVWKYGGEAS